jgi:hypothetical protein
VKCPLALMGLLAPGSPHWRMVWWIGSKATLSLWRWSRWEKEQWPLSTALIISVLKCAYKMNCKCSSSNIWNIWNLIIHFGHICWFCLMYSIVFLSIKTFSFLLVYSIIQNWEEIFSFLWEDSTTFYLILH